MTEDQDPVGDDDLFEFDELVEDEQTVAEAPSAAGEVAGGASSGPPDVEAGPELRPMGLVDDFDEDDEDELDEEPPQVVVTRAGLPPIVVPLLLVMAAANLALVGLTWKSLRAPAEATLPVMPDAQAIEHRTGEDAFDLEHRGGIETELVRQVPSLASSRDDAWAILDDAQRALDAGEYVPARRTLYAMLTVLDRVEASERPDLESRAGYLIAESYRRQAQALGALEAEQGEALP